MELNLGPQHPSTHGVLRVVLKLDGERIRDAKPVIGYLHRGCEKLGECRSYPQVVVYTDRMDYVAAFAGNLTYIEAVEKLWSRIDVLVNNAGIYPIVQTLECDAVRHDATFQACECDIVLIPFGTPFAQ